MEDTLKLLLVEQIEERKISLRDIQKEIDKICEADSSQQWISLSTLDRRINNPKKITDEEFILIRSAISNVLTRVEWSKLKRSITERLKYSALLQQAISNGFALHQNLVDYDNTKDEQFSSDALYFYRNAPADCRKYWDRVLETYLLLPDVSKAAIMCASYIGESVQKNISRNEKIMSFINLFPTYDGIRIADWFESGQIDLLSKILHAASICEDISAPDEYRQYAIDVKSIPKISSERCLAQTKEERQFVRLVRRYQNSVTDFKVCSYDFIKGLSFILFLDKTEWILAYATSIFSFHCDKVENRFQMPREYYETGCTGFRFTDRELGYLYTLIHEVVT